MIKKVKKNLVIVGGGGAGLFTGATVKQLCDLYDVYLISNENLFCRCSTPYVVTKKANFKDTIMPDQMITNFGINLINSNALQIDTKLKIVKYGKNLETAVNLNYDTLVMATGARSFIPPIQGIDLKNVFSVRTSDDLKAINSQVSKIKSATVIGGGVIGVEMVSALTEMGVKSNLLIMEDKPFGNIADDEFRDLIKENLVKNKVKVINNALTKRIIGDKKVEGVIYEKDSKFHTIKSDIVILATGVRSNVELLKDSGIKMNKFGILVDDYFRTSNKDIYAVGDVAVAKNFVTKTHTSSQLATNAVIQGKIAGKNIAGMKTKYSGHTSAMILQFLSEEYASCGVSESCCKSNNIDYFVGFSHSTDIYKDLIASRNVLVKLIFNKKNQRIIGVEAFGRNLVWIVNLISFAIQQNTKISDLMNLDYASHPSVTPWPFMDPIVDACEHAFVNFQRK